MRGAAWLTTVTLAACTATVAQERTAAVLVNPDVSVRAALTSAVRNALEGREVTLAADALTTEPHLTLERPPLRDPSGRIAQGRELGSPEVFHLFRQGKECVLVHERTKKEFVLPGAKCEAKSS